MSDDKEKSSIERLQEAIKQSQERPEEMDAKARMEAVHKHLGGRDSVVDESSSTDKTDEEGSEE